MKSLLVATLVIFSTSSVYAGDIPTLLKEKKAGVVQAQPPVAQPVSEKAPQKFTDWVEVIPVYSGEPGSQGCIYKFQGKCFDSKATLEKFLLAQLESGQQKPAEKSTLIKGGGSTDCWLYQGQCFLSEEEYFSYLIQRQSPGQQSPSDDVQNSSETKVETPTDWQQEKLTADHVIGTYSGRDRTFLIFGRYGKAEQRGPTGTIDKHFEMFGSNGQTGEVCLKLETLPGIVMPTQREAAVAMTKKILELPDGNIGYGIVERELLPNLSNGEIDSYSYKKSGQNLCYSVERGVSFVQADNVAPTNEAYNAVFEGFSGINALPLEVRARLQSAWDGGTTLRDKISAVEVFWVNEIEYLLDDFKLYKDYFSKNGEANLIQAACEIKKGRCVPKNFALAVSLFQLSAGELTVRMSHGLLIPGDKELKNGVQELHSDHLHLVVEVLLKDEKSGNWIWTGVEASRSTELSPEDQEALAKQVDAIKLQADIRKTVSALLKGITSLDLTVKMTTVGIQNISKRTPTSFSDSDGKIIGVAPGHGWITAISVEPSPAETNTFKMKIQETGKGLEVTMNDEKQEIPDIKIIDLFAGKPEILAMFMGLDPMDNQVSFSRGWTDLGGNRFLDSRKVSIELPDGTAATVLHTYNFDFNTAHIVTGVQESINGQTTYTAKLH